jgi:hypothetical protein
MPEFNNRVMMTLFKITAAIRHNSERSDHLEEVLRRFLIEPAQIDIIKETRNVAAEELKDRAEAQGSLEKTGEFPAATWFKQLGLLTRDVPAEHVPEYLVNKFLPFAEDFERQYNCRWDALLQFSLKFTQYLRFKMYLAGFDDSVYRFKSKAEYANPAFVAMPGSFQVEAWKNVSTFDIREVSRQLHSELGFHEMRYVVDVLTLEPEAISAKDPPNFILKPFLKTGKNTLILLTPDYLVRALPIIYETQFGIISRFREAKGRSFESLGKETMRALPFKTLALNRTYGGKFEVDAILEFEKSNWFVEVTSHPPSIGALQGNPVAVQTDLDRSIRKCIGQGKRCFEHISSPSLAYFGSNGKKNGIVVLVDGVYPQLNPTTAIRLFDEKMPIYVINWFDLRVILEQPELPQFEKFVTWRTTQPMPVICYDERDYWAYFFDRHLQTPEMKGAFGTAQKKLLRGFYISARFNDKRYLEEIAAVENH